MRVEKIRRDGFTLFSGQCKTFFYGFMRGIHAIPFTVLGKTALWQLHDRETGYCDTIDK